MTTIIEKRKALGRGLSSLLPGSPRVVPPPPVPPAAHIPAPPTNGTSAVVPDILAQVERKPADGDILEIALDLIDNNPYQTRGIFREDELRELAESIKASGVIQ